MVRVGGFRSRVKLRIAFFGWIAFGGVGGVVGLVHGGQWGSWRSDVVVASGCVAGAGWVWCCG